MSSNNITDSSVLLESLQKYNRDVFCARIYYKKSKCSTKKRQTLRLGQIRLIASLRGIRLQRYNKVLKKLNFGRKKSFYVLRNISPLLIPSNTKKDLMVVPQSVLLGNNSRQTPRIFLLLTIKKISGP